MPQLDYRAYAQTDAGKAARARAHARYVEKRKQAKPFRPNHQPLTRAIQIWKTA